jgi:parallel beta-helix repeat protein
LLAAGPRVVGFRLIDADADRPVRGMGALAQGAVLDLAALATRNLSIRADVRGRARSVVFDLDGGALAATEDRRPFYLAGNTRRDVHAWTPAVGTHTLTATPYRRRMGTGAAGAGLTLTFDVVDSAGAARGAYEVPAPVGAGVVRVVGGEGFDTIGAAVRAARPGDVVLVEPGTYHETIEMRRSGTAEAPITLAARSPGTVTVNGSGLRFVLGGNASNVRVMGITFDGCANGLLSAAVRVGSGWELSDVVVQNADGAGVTVYGSGVRLVRVTAQHNGHQGIAGAGCSDVLVKDCVTRFNNTGLADPVWKGDEHAIEIGGRWFVDPLWEAGAGKWSSSRRVTLDRVESYGNGGPGVWFDYDNHDVVVRNCTVHDNRAVGADFGAAGINIELTAGGVLLENNTVSNNPGGNIVLESSRNVVARGNTVRDGDVQLNDWYRGDAYTMRNVTFTDNRIENGVVETGGPGWTKRSAAEKVITFDRNVYVAVEGPVFRWGGVAYGSLATVREELGMEEEGRVVE